MRPEWLKVLSPKPRKASESGCPHCEYTGYSGRKMVYELLDITPEVRTAIEQNLPPSQISKVGIDESRTLRASGLRLVAKGLTALDEINRLTRKDG
jgi:type II secretory ATPase GspE/PulE/Tfp pilus assembly ATPase PilB-like protein